MKYLFVTSNVTAVTLSVTDGTVCHGVTAIAVAVIAIAVERRIVSMEGRTLPEKSQRYFKSRRRKKGP